ncbi:hypothetical protein Z517_09339 [Fonsecaea pedrosoi CBS 271.37]|uniref:Uncharacterized protein n=1 Tax=Fonsecaea pedrosoi CBS 271.37 TaxID=1442368 RepID=A0A0D2GE21_9EURO|nr:uncharacterized protein Z517_09339 [Fonsecaea pedrosoi CBS 271.37]KIW76895.1 hypothetical protein Z517_09339 [Fonsecaea pedrosoi CBS 271.37]
MERQVDSPTTESKDGCRLVLLRSENAVGRMTLYVRIRLPVTAPSKTYSARSMCGLVDELRDGSCWLNMDTNGGVLKDMPRTKFVYTTKSKDDLLAKSVEGVSDIVNADRRSGLTQVRHHQREPGGRQHHAVVHVHVDRAVPQQHRRHVDDDDHDRGQTHVHYQTQHADHAYDPAPKDEQAAEQGLRHLQGYDADTGCVRNMITTQPECDSHYKDAINYITHAVRVSYLGVTEVRNKIGHGVIFLDGDVSAPASPTSSTSSTSPRPMSRLEPVQEPEQPHGGGRHEQAGGVREDHA